MTRRFFGLCLVLLMALLLCTACNSQNKNPEKPVTTGFACDVDMTYQDMRVKGHLTRMSAGTLKMEFTEPATLNGMSMEWDGETISVKYAGLSFGVDPAAVPESALGKGLLDALDAPDDEYGTKMARLLHNVQAAGALTSVDVVSEAGDRFQRLVPPALKYTDYLIVNEIEAGKTAGLALRAPGGEIDEESVWEALRAIRRMGVSRWIVVHAPEGAWGLDENDREVFVRSAKLPQGYIQGTVGAGDAFCAGALLGAYRGEALKDALWYGAVAAACSLGKPGATEGVRKMEEALNAFERV